MFTMYMMQTRKCLCMFEDLRLIGHNAKGKFETVPIFLEN